MGCAMSRTTVDRVDSDVGDAFFTRISIREDRLAACDQKVLYPLLMGDFLRDHGRDPSWKHSKDKTIIMMDWDEMLFPLKWACEYRSTRGRRQALGDVRAMHRKELDVLSCQLVDLLNLAQQIGKVCVVTNEKLPWVHPTCSSLMPLVSDTLRGIPVVYTLAYASAALNSAGSEADLAIERKTLAMRAAVTESCSVSQDKAATNIVCIGDVRCDLTEIVGVAAENCKTKTIKTLESFSLPEMLLQQIVLMSWLSRVVHADFDFDVDFSVVTGSAVHSDGLRREVSGAATSMPDMQEARFAESRPCVVFT